MKKIEVVLFIIGTLLGMLSGLISLLFDVNLVILILVAGYLCLLFALLNILMRKS